MNRKLSELELNHSDRRVFSCYVSAALKNLLKITVTSLIMFHNSSTEADPSGRAV
jgi:hypothetical protein